MKLPSQVVKKNKKNQEEIPNYTAVGFFFSEDNTKNFQGSRNILKSVQIQEFNSMALTVIEILKLWKTEKGAVLKYQKVNYLQQW